MSSDYRAVLQLGRTPAGVEDLKRAYGLACARFLRLTQRGPLQFFRGDLLRQADLAYQQLHRGSLPGEPRDPARAKRLGDRTGPSGLNVELPRDPAASKSVDSDGEQRQKALIEDAFCREVIFRLEGDLIRYDSRRELLGIARSWHIHAFRANMLMAQIVEAVRQHRLYEPTRRERDMTVIRQQDTGLIGRLVTALAVAAGAAVIADLLVIRLLSG